MPPGSAAKPRLAYIDTLRGLAAFYVLVYHTALIPAPLAVPPSVAWLVLTGGTGVTLFFIISAFTLCASMESRSDDPHGLSDYFIRRVFRIVPLFYVWVALSALRDSWTTGVVHPWWRILLNLSFGYNFVPGEEASVVWGGWTLGVEMVFYLLFPLIVRYVTDVWRAAVFAALTIGLALAYGRIAAGWPIADAVRTSFLYISFLRWLPVFALGVLAYHVHRAFIRSRHVGRLGMVVSLVLVGSALAGYRALVTGRFGASFGDGLVVQALLYGLLLFGLSIVPWTIFVNRLTVFLGIISYSLYLNHPTVLLALGPIFQRIYAQPLPVWLQFGACVLLAAGVSVALSALSYRVIEQPGMRLGSRLARQLRERRAALQSVVG